MDHLSTKQSQEKMVLPYPFLWCLSVTTALGGLSWEDCSDLQASLSYGVKSCLCLRINKARSGDVAHLAEYLPGRAQKLKSPFPQLHKLNPVVLALGGGGRTVRCSKSSNDSTIKHVDSSFSEPKQPPVIPISRI